MKILVLNCGSSSVKYKLIETTGNEVLAQGGVEKIGLPDSFLKLTYNGEKIVLNHAMPDHKEAVDFIFKTLMGEYGCIKSLDEVDAVGHRVVHGGESFSESVLIDDAAMAKIVECIDVAPLHNPANIAGIKAVEALIPGKPQVAVFDTAFHQTMPAKAYMYALPYEMYDKYRIRRYGFHGTSHRYVSQRTCEYLGIDPKKTKMICCHIGNGASISAVLNGQSVDTTMGFTPVEGLMMGTRSGDIDAGALTFIMEKEGLDAKGISTLVNKKSGMQGLTGISSDMRDIYNAMVEGNERAKMALDAYAYRIKKYIGAYAAAMNGVDVIVFTGGVGENHTYTRGLVCSDMEYLGVKLDEAMNEKIHGDEAVISTPDSKVKVCVIPTDEESMIARDTQAIVEKLK
jgi:acetate kinase